MSLLKPQRLYGIAISYCSDFVSHELLKGFGLEAHTTGFRSAKVTLRYLPQLLEFRDPRGDSLSEFIV